MRQESIRTGVEELKVQPYMIHISYDHSNPPGNDKLLPIKSFQVRDSINYNIDRQCWQSNTYYRTQLTNKVDYNPIHQIGIKLLCEDKQGVNVYFEPLHKQNKDDLIRLLYNEKEDIWYERSRFKKSKDKNTNLYKLDYNYGISGIVHAGTLNVRVEKDGKELLKEKIVFFPSGVSMEDYETMISDLFRIREDFVRQDKTSVSVGSTSIGDNIDLDKIIDKLDSPIKMISVSPQRVLSFSWKKDKPENGEKYRLTTEIDKEMNPGKIKYPVFKPFKDYNLVENKIIKNELLKLLRYSEFYSEKSSVSKGDINQKINEINNILNKSSYQLRKLIGRSSFGKTSNINYMRVFKELHLALKENEKVLDDKLMSFKKELCMRSSKKTDETNSIPITIDCTLYSSQFYKNIEISQNGIVSKYNSGKFIEQSRKFPLTFDRYTFKSNVFENSIRCNIRCKSYKIENHLLLFKAFKYADQLLEKNPDTPIPIVVSGKSLYNEQPLNSSDDLDMIGKKNKYETLTDYDFTLKDIKKVIINNVEFKKNELNKNNFLDFIKSAYVPKSNHSNISEYIHPLNLDPVKSIKNHLMEISNLEFDIKTLKRIENINSHLLYANSLSTQYKEVHKRIEGWLSLPFFREINITGKEQLIPCDC